MNELPNRNVKTENIQGDLVVQKINKVKDAIIEELHNKEINSKLAPSEVSPTLLCSNYTVKGDTSLGDNNFDKDLLKKYLKIFALKIIEEEYEKYRNSGFNIHQSFNKSAGN